MSRHDKLGELADITNGIEPDRLREMCDAERERRCVVLPACKKCKYHKSGNISMACCNCVGEQRLENNLFEPFKTEV
jgi:hypothetical protein